MHQGSSVAEGVASRRGVMDKRPAGQPPNVCAVASRMAMVLRALDRKGSLPRRVLHSLRRGKGRAAVRSERMDCPRGAARGCCPPGAAAPSWLMQALGAWRHMAQHGAVPWSLDPGRAMWPGTSLGGWRPMDHIQAGCWGSGKKHVDSVTPPPANASSDLHDRPSATPRNTPTALGQPLWPPWHLAPHAGLVCHTSPTPAPLVRLSSG